MYKFQVLIHLINYLIRFYNYYLDYRNKCFNIGIELYSRNVTYLLLNIVVKEKYPTNRSHVCVIDVEDIGLRTNWFFE